MDTLFSNIPKKYQKLFWVLLYVAVAVTLLPWFYNEINPDGISYLSIAEKYAQGNFTDAINAYWSPLISWLLAPFLMVGFPAMLMSKILLIIIGGFIILISEAIVRQHTSRRDLYIGTMISVVAVTIWFSLIFFGADLLFTCLALLLVWYSDTKRLELPYSWLRIGLVGAGLFLTKSYGLPFFAAVFTGFCLVQFLCNDSKVSRRNIFRIYRLSMGLFLLISALWIFTISWNYGYFTMGTASQYNHSFVGPQSKGHPMAYAGLLKPPNSTAVSVWEDISHYPMTQWSSFESTANAKHQLSLLANNSIRTWRFLKHFSFLSTIILFSGFLYFLYKQRKLFLGDLFRYFLMSIILCGGYLLILVEVRYLWLLDYLLLFSATFLLDYFFSHFNPNRIISGVLTLVLIAGFVKTPILELTKYAGADDNIKEIHEEMPLLSVGCRVASIGNWHESLDLAYYGGWQYYGDVAPLDIETVQEQIDDYGIDYLLVWDSELDRPIPEGFEVISEMIGGRVLVWGRR